MQYTLRLLILYAIMSTQVFGQKIAKANTKQSSIAVQTLKPKLNHILASEMQELNVQSFTSNNSSVFWVEPTLRDDYVPLNTNQATRNIQDWCGTMPWWESRHSGQRSCNLMGVTDDPAVRDSYIPNDLSSVRTLRLYIHAFADDAGNNPTTTLAEAEAQLFTLNEAFLQHKIQFQAYFEIHNNSDYQVISFDDWQEGVFKEQYAADPTVYHNLYVMDTDADWSILGVSTFPWDSEALTKYGGTIVDKDWFGGPRSFNGSANIPNHTITHELGHALGLWHTHHGVDEVEECGTCYEGADGYVYDTGDDTDVVGDLCSDTKGTSKNFLCTDPDGTDCQNNPWVNTDVHNFMGYADDDCYGINNEGFSSQQSGRIHGWVADKYEGLVVSSDEITVLSASFEDGLPFDWMVYDMDGDGNTWSVYPNQTTDYGTYYEFAHFGQWGAGTYTNQNGNNDWLVTPFIDLPSNAQSITFSFWAKNHLNGYPENFNAMISADGSYFTSLPGSYNTVGDQTWENFSFDISSYYGQTVKLALVCLSNYGVYLMADDFAVSVNLETPEIESDFSLTPETGSAPLAVQFTDLSLGNPNNWYWSFGDGNTSTLQNPLHVFQDPGTYEVTLTVSNDTDSDTSPPKLVEVLTPVEIYLSESFESGLPDGWTIIDNNGDNFQWELSTYSYDGSYSMGMYYNYYGNDDWLVTPALEVPANAETFDLSFWARSLDGSGYYFEDFNVLVSTSGNSVSDFTDVVGSMTETPAEWNEYSYDLSDYAGETIYVGVQSVSVNDWYLLVDAFKITGTTFEQNSPPGEFSLLEPINDVVLNILNPPFCWEESVDPDGDEISYTVYLGENMDETTAVYIGPYSPACFYETMGLVEDNTTYYWKVVASDADGATTENTGGYHSFSINTGNDQPVAVDMEFEIQEDTDFDGLLEASDADGDLLTFNVFDDPETGEVDLDEYGEFTYTPLDNYHGTDSFTYEVCDQELCDIGTVMIYITPVNDDPFYVSEMQASVGLNMEFSIPLYAEDIDSETLSSSLTVNTLNPSWVFIENDHLQGVPVELGNFPIYLSLSDGVSTVLDTFQLVVENFLPEIVSIDDIPDDQGGRVYIHFSRSIFDNADDTNQMYTILRHDMIDDEPEWVIVGSGGAIGDDHYTYEVSTLLDATDEDDGMTEFKVLASMNEGHYYSLPAMGYSLDNIAPGVPEGLMAVVIGDIVELSWQPSSDEDFQYFIIEKSSDADFTSPETIEVVEPVYADVLSGIGTTNYYRLIAVDHAGNQSGYSVPVEATLLSIENGSVPLEFTLHQNHPNPFNPTTKIRYDLPEDAVVDIAVYDMMGRLIKTLASVQQKAGYHALQWDATNDFGQTVPAGVYMCTIQAGDRIQTNKMVLLK